MKWTVKLVAEVVDEKQIEHEIATIERADGISPATVGLTIAEGKGILKSRQKEIVTAQVQHHSASIPSCPRCGRAYRTLAFMDKEKIEGEVSAPCPTHEHFAPRGGGAVVDQWESVTKIPVQEHPNQVVNDREKRTRVKRAEPHGIRVESMVSGGQCLPQAGKS